MRKIFILFCLFLFMSCNAQILKGGVSEDIIPKGFFGSWGVISKLESSNNPAIFNFESRDVWMLSGFGNTLVLENLESGAKSQIQITEKPKDGKTLKFHREKTVSENNKKVVYKETVEFLLLGNNFSGTDNYIIERYDTNNKLVKKDVAKYLVAGIKISGDMPH